MAQSRTLQSEELRHTALYERHVALGGRMVEFAGYALPVQYAGIVAEHLHTRKSASLFDVSHMGQVTVRGPSHEASAAALEEILPGDIAGLAPGEMRYTVLLNAHGGIEDDLIVTRPTADAAPDGTLFIVVNAARKAHDLALFRSALGSRLDFILKEGRALLAVQGPDAADILSRFTDLPRRLGFMQADAATIEGIAVHVSRSGYTGEDGFEISVADAQADKLVDSLFADPRLKPAGLGARDSLRLEAGLCLYGHDMDETTDPVTAGLVFAIGKRRRSDGGFAGADAVLARLREGPERKRVGIRFDGRQPVREGADLVDEAGTTIGMVTSGTYSPTLQAPVAMGYLPANAAEVGAAITAIVRGKPVSGTVVKMPFVPQNYVRRPPAG